MTFETRQVYSEVCAVLEQMPDEYIKKIPEKIIKLFQSKKLENYQVNINKSNLLDKNYLNRKTIVIIAILNYNYWCPNKIVKNELYKKYLSNNKKYEEEIRKKYKTDNLFTNKKIEFAKAEKNNYSLVKHKEKSFIQIIWNRIKSIF